MGSPNIRSMLGQGGYREAIGSGVCRASGSLPLAGECRMRGYRGGMAQQSRRPQAQCRWRRPERCRRRRTICRDGRAWVVYPRCCPYRANGTGKETLLFGALRSCAALMLGDHSTENALSHAGNEAAGRRNVERAQIGILLNQFSKLAMNGPGEALSSSGTTSLAKQGPRWTPWSRDLPN